MKLDTGGTAYADYVNGSGSTALVFRLTVATGENDATGIQVGMTLDANGGTVRDTMGNEAASALNAVASTAAVNVDAIAPSPTAIVRASPSPTHASGLDYTVTFSENVTGVDVTDFTLTSTDTATANIASVTQVDGRTYVVHLRDVGGSGSLRLDLAAQASGIADGAGNALAAGAQGEVYTVGGVAPVILAPAAPPPVAAAPVSTFVSRAEPAPLSERDLPTLFFADAAPQPLLGPFSPGAFGYDGVATFAVERPQAFGDHIRDGSRLPQSAFID